VRLELAVDLVLPEAGLLLIEGRDGLDVMQQAMLRLLLGSPLGKIRFTIADPIGLGTGFAALLQLRDHDRAPGRSQGMGPVRWRSSAPSANLRPG
jgi:hypothetical protein